MEKKHAFPIMNIGSVSLLMIFIVLSLVSFATLSLSDAASDYQYSKRLADHNTAYYQADSKANEVLQQIDEALHLAYEESPGAYYTAASVKLASIEGVSCDTNKVQPTATFEVAISDSQALYVELNLNSPTQLEDGYYSIQTWKEVSTAQWEGDDTLHLLPM